MDELKHIAHHAGVVLVGQLAVMAFGVTDTMVAARYSEAALAALSVGTAVYISVYVGLMGILQALLPVWAELHGARRPADVGPSVRQWREQRAVPLRAKQLASLMMAISCVATLLALRWPWGALPLPICALVALWLWRLPTADAG